MSAGPGDGIRRLKGEAVLADGTRMTYREYVKSEFWAAVKRRYRISRLPQACWCGEKKTDLHHRSYKNLGNERLMDLVPLCRGGHYSRD